MDIPKKVREDIKIIPVESANEVLKIALIKELKPVEWTEVENISESKNDDNEDEFIEVPLKLETCKKTKKVWPISGCVIKRKIIGVITIKLKKYL